MKKLNTQLTPEEALRLADRYFEAQTSEEEEERLRDFLLIADSTMYELSWVLHFALPMQSPSLSININTNAFTPVSLS